MNNEKWMSRFELIARYFAENTHIEDEDKAHLDWYITRMGILMDDDLDDVEDKRRCLWKSITNYFSQMDGAPLRNKLRHWPDEAFIESMKDEITTAYKLAYDIMPKNFLTKHVRSFSGPEEDGVRKVIRNPFYTDRTEYAEQMYLVIFHRLKRMHRMGQIEFSQDGFTYTGDDTGDEEE